jgi:hypothetical protein
MKKILAGFALLLSCVVNAAPFTVNHLIDTVPNPSINYQSSATGSVVRSYQSKLGDVVNVLDFGADPTGAVDSTAAIQSAANSLSAGGGVVKLQGKFLESGTLTLPAGVSLEGSCEMPGSLGTNASSPYGTYTCGVIKLASAATVKVGAGGTLKSLIIYRSDMTFPAADSSLFAGTAITANGDDVSVDRVLVMGFNQGFISNNWQRTRISYFYGDNNNGIDIGTSYDIAYISHSHMWPFSTIGSTGSYTINTRSGTAYYLHDVADWAKVTDSFSWGYYRGYSIFNANSVTLLGVGADNAYSAGPLYTGSIGIVVAGTSQDTRIIGAQTAAQANAGIYINTSAGLVTTIIGHNAWGGSTHGELVNSGDLITSDGVMRGVSSGISVNNSASRVTATGMRFQQITSNAINPVVASSLIFLGGNDYGDYVGIVANSSMTSQSVASADPLVLSNSGNVFNISGTTNFGTLQSGHAGRTVTLIFSGNLTVLNGSSMSLKNGANFTTSAGSSLTLTYNGTNWTETGRSEKTPNPASVTTLTATGQITSSGLIAGATSVASNTTVGNSTLTAAKMLTGNILRSGSTAPYTDTTDTATNILASIPNAVAGVGYELTIANTVAFTETLAAGTGVTLSGTTAIAASASRKYVVTITNVSTPAVTITGVSSGGL